MLCDILNKKFGYETWHKQNKGKPIVVVSGNSYDDLTRKVYPHIVPCMQHKWPTARKS